MYARCSFFFRLLSLFWLISFDRLILIQTIDAISTCEQRFGVVFFLLVCASVSVCSICKKFYQEKRNNFFCLRLRTMFQLQLIIYAYGLCQYSEIFSIFWLIAFIPLFFGKTKAQHTIFSLSIAFIFCFVFISFASWNGA